MWSWKSDVASKTNLRFRLRGRVNREYRHHQQPAEQRLVQQPHPAGDWINNFTILTQ